MMVTGTGNIVLQEEIMKKRFVSILAAGLCASILAGCQETPKESIVKQKGAANVKEYESAEHTDSPLRETLGAPEHYKNEKTYENGALVIDTDADVVLPNVQSINTYAVSAKEASQELIETVTNAFFEEGKFYSSYTYNQWTKEDYQKEITILKKYKAEGNLDPYEMGKDEETGEMYFNIDEIIAMDEQKMRNAPDEITKEEVKPSFGLEHLEDVKGDGSKEEKVKDETDFWGVAETKEGIYDYHITNGLAPDTVFKIEKKRDDIKDTREFAAWLEGEYGIKREEDRESGISEEKAEEYIGISYEEAEKTAKERVEKLGWNLDIYGWDYALFYHGEQGVKNDNVLDGGYMFHFTRMLDEVPITYTSSYGGGLEDMDSTLKPWSYERCDVIVGDDGVQKVEIFNPYDIGEVQTENVKLMSFEEIIKIYEQMMEVSNADVAELEKKRTYHIKKITLGLTRIYDPNTDNDTGLLVPVWDFFGGFDVEDEEYGFTNSGEYSTQSHMTINAIDGTVIDRELGY